MKLDIDLVFLAGDVMGCGIYFPPDYDSDAEVNSNDEEEEDLPREEDDDEEGDVADDEDDLLDAFFHPQRRRPGVHAKGTKVTVRKFIFCVFSDSGI